MRVLLAIYLDRVEWRWRRLSLERGHRRWRRPKPVRSWSADAALGALIRDSVLPIPDEYLGLGHQGSDLFAERSQGLDGSGDDDLPR